MQWERTSILHGRKTNKVTLLLLLCWLTFKGVYILISTGHLAFTMFFFYGSRLVFGVWCLGSDLITPCRCSLGDSVRDEKIFPTPLAGACGRMLVMVMGWKNRYWQDKRRDGDCLSLNRLLRWEGAFHRWLYVSTFYLHVCIRELFAGVTPLDEPPRSFESSLEVLGVSRIFQPIGGVCNSLWSWTLL